ncbi:MAG: site-specific DNA-methyltransferase [Ignavibacteriaceae bacterium]|nr:site-specific DNA-methyltransferase [Ignavibacteriaceae bacterium]
MLKNKSQLKSTKEKLTRLDINDELRKKILPYCRLKRGDIWIDPKGKHKVGVLDATSISDTKKLFGKEKAKLVINDPPYNVVVGNVNTQNLSKISIIDYIEFSRKWIFNVLSVLDKDSSLYIWLGADQNDGFQPLPEFMIMMREFEELKSRSFITMRNQRGYGTQKNWMSVRQELLYYTKGNPHFKVIYTDIPKILGGYYKKVNGKVVDNFERSKSGFIRPGNVWVDIQQVFYRMEENVPGAYAQKPLKSISRIIQASSKKIILLRIFSVTAELLFLHLKFLIENVMRWKLILCSLNFPFDDSNITAKQRKQDGSGIIRSRKSKFKSKKF